MEVTMLSTTLSTTVRHIFDRVPNYANSQLIADFLPYIQDNITSERHRKNLSEIHSCLCRIVPDTTFPQLTTSDQIASMILKSRLTPMIPICGGLRDKKTIFFALSIFLGGIIITGRIDQTLNQSLFLIDWKTPAIGNIKKKRTEKLSP
jgi:hypothetical protein